MPLYDYCCKRGHVTTALVRLDQSDAPAACAAEIHDHVTLRLERCGQPVERIMSAPSGSFPGAGTWRGGR